MKPFETAMQRVPLESGMEVRSTEVKVRPLEVEVRPLEVAVRPVPSKSGMGVGSSEVVEQTLPESGVGVG